MSNWNIKNKVERFSSLRQKNKELRLDAARAVLYPSDMMQSAETYSLPAREITVSGIHHLGKQLKMENLKFAQETSIKWERICQNENSRGRQKKCQGRIRKGLHVMCLTALDFVFTLLLFLQNLFILCGDSEVDQEIVFPSLYILVLLCSLLGNIFILLHYTSFLSPSQSHK